MDQAQKSLLKNYASRYVDLNVEDFAELSAAMEVISVSKKGILSEPGEVCKSQYFLLKGCFRSYYIDQKGNEQIMNFAIENWWMTDYPSYVNNKPSTLYFQALEDAELLKIDKSQLENLFDQYPKIERLFRLICEKTYIAAQHRIEHMLSLTNEETYEIFEASTYPFSERIPQYMIASYLGFTPEFLSMIRSRKNAKK